MKSKITNFLKKHSKGVTLAVTSLLLVAFLVLGIVATIREPVICAPCLLLVALCLYVLGRIKEICAPSLEDLQNAFNGLNFDEVTYDTDNL